MAWRIGSAACLLLPEDKPSSFAPDDALENKLADFGSKHVYDIQRDEFKKIISFNMGVM